MKKNNNKRSLIILEPCAGLGNRFQAIASAYYLSNDIGGGLIIIWKKEEACGISSKQLFQLEDEVDILQINAMGFKDNILLYLYGILLRKFYKMKSDEFIDCDNIKNLYSRKGSEGVKAFFENKIIYVKSTNQFYDFPIASPYGVFSFMSPVYNIKKRVEAIMNPYANKKIVGVHIRRTDNLNAIKYSTNQAFIACMLSEITKDSEVMFYFASDDEKITTEFKKMFSDRIILMENKDLNRARKDGILDAYVELLCLSSCARVIGSYGSSYSKLAALIGNIDLDIA